MTYSELPPVLIYEKRETLDNFDVDYDNINGELYDKLLNVRCLQIPYTEMRKHILSIFNDVYYICTMLLVEYRPMDHYGQYLSVARKEIGKMSPSEREAIVMSMVHCILWSLGTQHGIPIWVNLLLEKIDSQLKTYAKNTPEFAIYSTIVDGFDYRRFEVTKEMFQIRPTKYFLLLLEDEFWNKVTNNFDLGTIIELSIRVGYTREDKKEFINHISRLARYHYEEEYADYPDFWAKREVKWKMEMLHKLEDDPNLIPYPIPEDRIVHLEPPMIKTTILPPGRNLSGQPKQKNSTAATFTYSSYKEDKFAKQRLEFIASDLNAMFIAGNSCKSLIKDLFTGIEIGLKTKIKWKGTKAELVYFFKQLNEKNYIKWSEGEMMWVIVASHFVIETIYKSGKKRKVSIDAESLQSYTSKPKEESKRILDTIIGYFEPNITQVLGLKSIDTEQEAEDSRNEKLAKADFVQQQRK